MSSPQDIDPFAGRFREPSLEAQVVALHERVGDHERRLRDMDRLNLVEFRTEVKITLGHMNETLGKIVDIVDKQGGVQRTDEGAKQARKDFITYKLVPMISIAAVVITIIALVLTYGGGGPT